LTLAKKEKEQKIKAANVLHENM